MKPLNHHFEALKMKLWEALKMSTTMWFSRETYSRSIERDNLSSFAMKIKETSQTFWGKKLKMIQTSNERYEHFQTIHGLWMFSAMSLCLPKIVWGKLLMAEKWV